MSWVSGNEQEIELDDASVAALCEAVAPAGQAVATLAKHPVATTDDSFLHRRRPTGSSGPCPKRLVICPLPVSYAQSGLTTGPYQCWLPRPEVSLPDQQQVLLGRQCQLGCSCRNSSRPVHIVGISKITYVLATSP